MGEFNAPGISKSAQGKTFRFKTKVPNGIDHQPLADLLVTLEASQHNPSWPRRYHISLQRWPQHQNPVLFYQSTHSLRHRGSRSILNGHPGSASLFRYSETKLAHHYGHLSQSTSQRNDIPSLTYPNTPHTLHLTFIITTLPTHHRHKRRVFPFRVFYKHTVGGFLTIISISYLYIR